MRLKIDNEERSKCVVKKIKWSHFLMTEYLRVSLVCLIIRWYLIELIHVITHIFKKYMEEAMNKFILPKN